MKRPPTLCVAGLLVLAVLGLAQPASINAQAISDEARPYPQGRKFPLGLYSLDIRASDSLHAIEGMSEFDAVKSSGWNMGHTYGQPLPLLEKLSPAKMFCLTKARQKTEEAAKTEIEQLAAYDAVAWWDLPEEQRWWRKDEFDLIKNLCAWTRKYDPKRRPNFMYLPGHYGADGIARYVPYLDIIGAGAYTEYAHQPRVWVRWRIESEIEAIHQAGAKVGADYLHGERTPIAVLMCFQLGKRETNKYQPDFSRHDIITPVEAYHDFYCSLAAGARGITVFSYFHRNDTAVLRETFKAYSKAASEVAGTPLGEALLFGEEAPLVVEITEGPARTPAFCLHGMEKDMDYPAINARAVKWEGNLYIVAVSSAEFSTRLKATVKGLPAQAKEAEVLFENRTVPVRDGALDDQFGWLGVHVYMVALGD